MSAPAWQVSTWTPVRRPTREWFSIGDELRLLSASINVDHEAGGIRYGQVLWGCASQGAMIGLAWDWREVRRDVIAMADPMTILSNVVLIDDAGVELSDSRRLICFNTTVRSLEWQAPLTTPHTSPVRLLAA